MALFGTSVPLHELRPEERPVATLVICPNQFSHARLMQALNNIVPEAAAVSCDGHGNTPPHADYGHPITPSVLAEEVFAPDEPPLRACAAGGCGDE